MNLAKLNTISTPLVMRRIQSLHNGIYCRLVSGARQTLGLTSISKCAYIDGALHFAFSVLASRKGVVRRVVFYDHNNDYIGHCSCKFLKVPYFYIEPGYDCILHLALTFTALKETP